MPRKSPTVVSSATAAAAAATRRRAEQRLQERPGAVREAGSAADTQRLLHELQVHQIELELQNEELQQARDAMEAGLEKYTDLFDFAPIGYLTLDRDGSIREANLAACNLLGIDRARLLQQRFALRIAVTDRPAFAAFLHQVSAEASRLFCEVSLLRDHAPSIAVRIEAALAASGEEYRVAVVDVTARNLAERDRLVLGKLESTGILAGGIAHDFNNLLTVVFLNLGQARALAAGAGEPLARLLEETTNTVLVADGLTKQLITFARGGRPVRKLASLADILPEAIRAALSGSSVRGETVWAEDLWLTEVDEEQIGQVMRNLVLNAREAMPAGGVVSIRAENLDLPSPGIQGLSPGRYVAVSVTDRGTGIAPEVLPKIFDPYFSTKQRGTEKGMGLGLAICHAIMRQHGGAIGVRSEVGVGTTFLLHLPASRQAPGARISAPAPLRQPRRATILVMDDEPALRKAVGATLQRLGHAVELVADGQQAIDAYRSAQREERTFDLVILDLTVRDGLGGAEAMEVLRRIDPDVKGVVMTGYSSDPAFLEPGRYGFAGVLAKPFDGVKLEELIARFCPQVR